MAGSQIPTSVTILNSLKGFQAVSLTEYNTSAAASIAAGSVVEIAGAFFTFVSDEAINASSWTAIVTGTTAYITLTPSGTAGSQIVDVAYTSTAPTWRDDHQGWYASAASNVRVIGSVYKAEATNYAIKYIYPEHTAQRPLLQKVIEIGDWDMSLPSPNVKSVAHGIADKNKIRDISVIIRGDSGYGGNYRKLDMFTAYTTATVDYGGFISFDSTNVSLVVTDGGVFSNANYNSTGWNRGWITITYEY